MAFGTPRGSGKTPIFAGLISGLLGGINAFQEARQAGADRKRAQAIQDQELQRQKDRDAWAAQDQAYQQQQRALGPAHALLNAYAANHPEDAQAAAEQQYRLDTSGGIAPGMGAGSPAAALGPQSAPPQLSPAANALSAAPPPASPAVALLAGAMARSPSGQAAPPPMGIGGGAALLNSGSGTAAPASVAGPNLANPLSGLPFGKTAKQIQDEDEQKKGLLALLTHAIAQNPEDPAGLYSGIQSVYATGHLPQVDTQVPLPVGAPGLPGGVSVPTPVKGPVSLPDVLASGGKSAAERALAQKATEAEANRGSRERIAAIAAASKQYKSWDDLKRDLTKEWLKGGGNAWEFQPYLDAQREEWNRDHPTATPVPAPPPAAEGASAPPPLVLPGAAAKVAKDNAQAGVANSTATAIPQRVIETNRHNLATEGTAAKNAETQRVAMEARKALGWENLSEAQVRDKWAHDDRVAANKIRDKGTPSQADRIALISARATQQIRVQAAKPTGAQNDPAFLPRVRDAQHELDGLRTQRRAYERTKSNAVVGIQNATDDATKQQAQNALDEATRNIGTLDRKIDGAAGRLKGLLDQGPVKGGPTAPSGGAPALPESTFSPSTSLPTASAGLLSQKRAQAQARFQSKWGLTPDEARRRAVQLFPGP